MKKLTFFILTLTVLLFSCEKSNNNTWTEEDQVYYNNVITLQETAYENFTTSLQTMDTLEAINQLQQFFLADSTVVFAEADNDGIGVLYSNGMRGGICINPDDEFGTDSPEKVLLPKTVSSGLNEKSFPNPKKAIFLNPSYWDRSANADAVIADYNLNLPRVGFNLQAIYKNEEANVDRFTKLSGYGLIHVYSHGKAWPTKQNLLKIFLMTGEKVNDATSAKYWLDIVKGNLAIVIRAESSDGNLENIYHLSEEFVAAHNDFSKDTILFYGGFCFSHLDTWPQLASTFAGGDYFGFSWRVRTSWNCNLAKDLIGRLTDTQLPSPVSTGMWYTDTDPSKQKWDQDYNKYCTLMYTGDPDLVMWAGLPKVETFPVSEITGTSATCTGNVISDGGSPVIARGICWNAFPNPTIYSSHSTDGSGTGSFTGNIIGLTENTPYYVRAYASNSYGTGYGDEVSFTATGELYIGKQYGGGTIFYLDGSGHGLIAKNENFESGETSDWGCFGTSVGTSGAVGSGQANTTAIVNSGCDNFGAAYVCNYYGWYLPSIDELTLMWEQREVIGNFDPNGSYWSSTEADANKAYYVHWYTGVSYPYDKFASLHFRGVRSF
jgi:hypothetical protein